MVGKMAPLTFRLRLRETQPTLSRRLGWVYIWGRSPQLARRSLLTATALATAVGEGATPKAMPRMEWLIGAKRRRSGSEAHFASRRSLTPQALCG